MTVLESRSVKFAAFSMIFDRMAEEDWSILRDCGGAEYFASVRFWFPDYILVDGTYMDDEAIRVTPLDLDGNCLVRVDLTPDLVLHNVLAYMEISECIAADAQLLSYAR